MENKQAFNYLTLRAIIGVIAFALPVLTPLFSKWSLGSISEYYHSESGNIFVGSLCVIGALLMAYNGWSKLQKWLAKLAALAAVGIAFFPTDSTEVITITNNNCIALVPSFISTLHYLSAGILFVILIIFCFVFFQANMTSATGGMKRRGRMYLVCGWTMIVCMLAIVLKLFNIELFERVTYWAESVALFAFGVAWIISGKHVPGFRGN